MKSMMNFTGKLTKNRFSLISYKNITISEIKRRKLESLKSGGKFSDNPSSDQ
jgi:hypothetical protein